MRLGLKRTEIFSKCTEKFEITDSLASLIASLNLVDLILSSLIVLTFSWVKKELGHPLKLLALWPDPKHTKVTTSSSALYNCTGQSGCPFSL